ncbi:hypothetical protein [Methylosinus sp. Sm6]|uniref:hypothetical protein n=1 Tax=Methylosinus sp. Sm6 TaxID=2866948 RepID=UPI001C99E236|nr:hypothetical protein [Methylosinus sp. Sm6]MBY6241713.1 hypothetical protein [Methylosinus sp. Sm6]
MRLGPHLTIAAVLALTTVLGASAATAQEWTLDTSALGASAPAKGKKAKPQSAASPADRGAAGAKTDNRQFGELEGWSPGKSPPKPKEKQDDTPRFGKAPVNMNSNGGMGVGMPF